MADPRMLEKKRKKVAEDTARTAAGIAERLDLIAPKIEQIQADIARILHILETNPHLLTPSGEESGPAVIPAGRRRRPAPEES